MEEKERYEVYKDNRGNAYICDTIKNIDYKIYQEFVDLLNQQDKENQQLKQQLHDLPNKIVEEIKLQLFNHFKVKNIEEYEKLPLIDSLFTADTVIKILDEILKKYGGDEK